MKNLNIIIQVFLFIFLTNILAAQEVPVAPNIEWERNFGGSFGDDFSTMIPTDDGGYIAVGNNDSDGNTGLITGGNGSDDAWVVKLTSSNGVISWSDSFGGTGNETAKDIVEIPNGYVVAGGTNSNSPTDDIQNSFGSSDAWVFKLNDFGQLQWSYGYGTNSNDIANTIVATNDGGFLVGGRKNNDAWLFKVNANGIQVWQKDSDPSLWGYDIRQLINTSDGGYLAIGTLFDSAPVCFEEDVDMWVIKLNSNLQVEWNKRIGGDGSDYIANVVQTIGGYVLTGNLACNSNSPLGFSGRCIMKIDTNGNVVWIKPTTIIDNGVTIATFQIADGAFALTNDGGFITGGQAIGTSNSTSCINRFNGSEDWLLFRFDSNGDPLWFKPYGGTEFDEIKYINQLPNGGFITGGDTNSNDGDVGGNFGSGSFLNSDWWIAETTPENDYCHLEFSYAGGGLLFVFFNSIEIDGIPNNFNLTAGNIAFVNLTSTMTSSTSAIWYVWVDYNQDGDFDDAGEFDFLISTVNAGTSDVTIGLIVPPDALHGTTRMRVALQEGQNFAVNSCDLCWSNTLGEVRDFEVFINSTNTCPVTRNVFNNPIPSDTYEASNTVTSSSFVAPNSTVIFNAGNNIMLSENFTVPLGSVFEANILGCTNPFNEMNPNQN